MDLYQTKDFIATMYPNSKIDFVMDKDCVKEFNLITEKGSLSDESLVVYNKVKVLVDGIEKHLMPIDTHRELTKTKTILEMING